MNPALLAPPSEGARPRGWSATTTRSVMLQSCSIPLRLPQGPTRAATYLQAQTAEVFHDPRRWHPVIAMPTTTRSRRAEATGMADLPLGPVTVSIDHLPGLGALRLHAFADMSAVVLHQGAHGPEVLVEPLVIASPLTIVRKGDGKGFLCHLQARPDGIRMNLPKGVAVEDVRALLAADLAAVVEGILALDPIVDPRAWPTPMPRTRHARASHWPAPDTFPEGLATLERLVKALVLAQACRKGGRPALRAVSCGKARFARRVGKGVALDDDGVEHQIHTGWSIPNQRLHALLERHPGLVPSALVLRDAQVALLPPGSLDHVTGHDLFAMHRMLADLEHGPT